jgi:hypothetical protein
MKYALTISDPTSALMLTNLGVDRFGQVRPRGDLHRAQRRQQRRSRLLKLLA